MGNQFFSPSLTRPSEGVLGSSQCRNLSQRLKFGISHILRWAKCCCASLESHVFMKRRTKTSNKANKQPKNIYQNKTGKKFRTKTNEKIQQQQRKSPVNAVWSTWALTAEQRYSFLWSYRSVPFWMTVCAAWQIIISSNFPSFLRQVIPANGAPKKAF